MKSAADDAGTTSRGLSLTKQSGLRNLGVIVRPIRGSKENAAAANSLYPPEYPRAVDQNEAAAWVALASVLLNLDEFMTRE